MSNGTCALVGVSIRFLVCFFSGVFFFVFFSHQEGRIVVCIFRLYLPPLNEELCMKINFHIKKRLDGRGQF